jgi:hypothetical protein
METARLLFKNRRQPGSGQTRGSNPPASRAHGSSRSTGGVFVRALTWLWRLIVWMLVILAGGGLVTGHLSLHDRGRTAAEKERGAARRPGAG